MLPMISPAEISKASAGSIVMMSSKAAATTSVSFGVAACAGIAPRVAASRESVAAPSQRRQIGNRERFIGESLLTGSLRRRAVYTRPDSGINTNDPDDSFSGRRKKAGRAARLFVYIAARDYAAFASFAA